MFSQELFTNPPAEYRGTDFWMLNDALEEDEIRRQLAGMREQGIASVIARTYIGLKSDYPGADFKRKMRCLVDAAKELGINVFLQAGYMPEAVLDLPDEFALRKIAVCPEAEAAGRGEVLATDGGYAYVAVNTRTFLDMLSKDAIAFYLKQSYEDMWAEFAADYGDTCLSVWVDEPSYMSDGLPWSEALRQEFRHQWGYELAPKVPLLYRDLDGHETVRYHYWQTVQRLLKEAYFMQVRDWCASHGLLFSGHLMMEDTLASQLSRAGAVMPYYKFFDIPGIDYLTAEMSWRHAPLPSRYPSLTERAGLFTTPLQCASAAHQAGKGQILAEMYGVSSENLTFRDQKHMFDHFASFGVNHKSVHGIFYSLRGRGKRAYPPHINYYQPYWKDYRMLTDACARTSYFISQGRPVRDIALIHPLSSASCELRGPGSPDGADPRLAERDRDLLELEVRLLGARLGVEYVDEDTLQDWGHVRDDDAWGARLVVGEMDYGVIVLPRLRAVAEATLATTLEFLRRGGRVLVLGDAPSLVDGQVPAESPDERLRQGGAVFVGSDDELLDALLALPRPYWLEAEPDDSMLLVNHRRDAESDYLFIFNRDCREPRQLTLTLPGNRLAVLLPDDGGLPTPLPRREAADGGTAFTAEVPEGGSLMLMVRDTEAPLRKTALPFSAERSVSLELPSAWDLEMLSPNVLYLEFASYRTDSEPFGKAYPILAIHDRLVAQDYHGPLALRFEFESEVELQGLKLALESPRGQRISLNGVDIPVAPDGYHVARQFETVPLTAPVRRGINVLEVSREDYCPLARFKSSITSLFENLPGVELEPMYLVGDFGVAARRVPSRANGVRLSHRMRLTASPRTAGMELTASGLPFYSGTVALSQTMTIPEGSDCRNAILELDGLCACHARVLLDGVPQGETAWAPYAVALPNLTAGVHTLRLELTNTMHNVIGPFHRPKGDYGEAWSGYGFPNLPWTGAVDEHTRKPIPNWEESRERDTSAWTEDYILTPFGLIGAAIVLD